MLKSIQSAIKKWRTTDARQKIIQKYSEIYYFIKDTEIFEPTLALEMYLNIISKMADESNDIEKEILIFSGIKDFEGVVEILKILQTLLISTRDPHGMNRTNTNQVVTSDDIYLGNICGLFTKNLTYWKSVKNDPPPGPDINYGVDWNNTSAYTVIINKVITPFLDHHRRQIKEIALKISYCEVISK
ncbi:MAG: hypothetical protein WCG01_01965 [bacterium]